MSEPARGPGEGAAQKVVRIERDGDVAVVVVDNPPVNAGSWAVRDGLAVAIEECARDPSVSAAVLIGAGTTFIAGADIKEFDKPLRDPQVPAIIAALEQCPKPFVAAIHGAALGGGYEIALGCDARIAVKDAVVGLPEVHLGIIPGAGGTQRMPRLVGIAKAIELICSGRRVRAEEAQRLGLIDMVVEGDLRAAAVNHARSLVGRKHRIRDGAVPADPTDAIERAVAAAQAAGRRNPAIAAAITIIRRAGEVPIEGRWPKNATCFNVCAQATPLPPCVICSLPNAPPGALPARRVPRTEPGKAPSFALSRQ